MLLGEPIQLSAIMFFLISTILGKSFPLPNRHTHPKTALLCLMWLVAMACISTYVQSDLTSESTVPTTKGKIDTIKELQDHVQSGRVLPCVRAGDFGHKYIAARGDSLATLLHKPLKKFPDSCIGDLDGVYCYTHSSKGTHVFIDRVLGGIDLYEAAQYGLVASRESITHSWQAVLAAKDFPFTEELLRLTRIVAQSGLADRERRVESWQYPVVHEKRHAESAQQSRISSQFCLYFLGLILSTLTFVGELLIKQLCSRLPHHCETSKRWAYSIAVRPAVHDPLTPNTAMSE